MKQSKSAPYLFIAPYVLCYFAFSLFPILFTFAISLTNWQGTAAKELIGFANYAELLGDARVFKALGNTLLFMVMIIPIQLLLATALAGFLSRPMMKFVSFFRLVNFLPYLVTPISMGIIFALIFQWNGGVFNNLLLALGLTDKPIFWLGSPWTSRLVVALITIWKYFGYTAVLLLSGMTTINTEVLEAATVDGASEWQKFTRITLPLLKPIFTFVLITTMIGCFQIFDEPLLLFSSTQSVTFVGGPQSSCLSVIWLLYDTAFSNAVRIGYGSAISVAMFVVISIISFITMRIMNRGNR